MQRVRDPYLTAIIDEVERNGEALHVSFVLQSGTVVTGYVRQSHFFVALTRKETNALPQKLPGWAAEERKLLERSERTLAALDSVREEDARGAVADHITMSNVTMLWSTGDGIRLELVRIDLDAIAGWRLKQGEPTKGKKDASGFWAIGVSF
jgi:hypothetical protein